LLQTAVEALDAAPLQSLPRRLRLPCAEPRQCAVSRVRCPRILLRLPMPYQINFHPVSRLHFRPNRC
jgi:hypothetical protein